MRVIVFHSSFGCDTGCCGHVVRLDNGCEKFRFVHPGSDDPRAFAEDLIRESFGEEHVRDLDWEHCCVTDD